MHLIHVVAGIHHIVLDQNLVTLQKDLIIGERIQRLWKKMSPLQYHIPQNAQREEIICKFAECLKWCPLRDYKHFVRLLHKTKQTGLAGQLTASCKVIFICVTPHSLLL